MYWQDILIQLNMILSGGPANRLLSACCAQTRRRTYIIGVYAFILNHVPYMHSHSIIFIYLYIYICFFSSNNNTHRYRFLYFSNAFVLPETNYTMCSQHILFVRNSLVAVETTAFAACRCFFKIFFTIAY